ncbi:MAG: hypothetical protein J5780_04535 [Treponema sp.]|nr:hypothetical protein [Treponema sp.]
MSDNIYSLTQNELDKLADKKKSGKISVQEKLKKEISRRLLKRIKNLDRIDDAGVAVKQEEVDALFAKDRP